MQFCSSQILFDPVKKQETKYFLVPSYINPPSLVPLETQSDFEEQPSDLPPVSNVYNEETRFERPTGLEPGSFQPIPLHDNQNEQDMTDVVYEQFTNELKFAPLWRRCFETIVA